VWALTGGGPVSLAPRDRAYHARPHMVYTVYTISRFWCPTSSRPDRAGQPAGRGRPRASPSARRRTGRTASPRPAAVPGSGASSRRRRCEPGSTRRGGRPRQEDILCQAVGAHLVRAAAAAAMPACGGLWVVVHAQRGRQVAVGGDFVGETNRRAGTRVPMKYSKNFRTTPSPTGRCAVTRSPGCSLWGASSRAERLCLGLFLCPVSLPLLLRLYSLDKVCKVRLRVKLAERHGIP
jgi:hypothetical protein